ncbi:MAG: DnaA ATPase domain-containing protein, partial [Gammaproteobacteria bacterium]
MAEQLPLNVRLREGVSFDSFYPGDNKQAVACLERMAEGHGERQVFVWGAPQTGKSHLLQAVCQRAYARGVQAMYVPLAEFGDANVLSDLEQAGVLCIDDLDMVAGKPVWEESLFHLINKSRDGQRTLLLASTQNPAHLGTTLDDLASRLLWGPVFR